MLKTIKLYGDLGAKFGRVHKMAVKTPAEAIRALCVVIDGFERYIMNARADKVGFAVFKGDSNIGKDDLHDNSGSMEIRIAPITGGRKSGGIFQILAGAALIVASIYTGGAAFAAASAMATAMAGAGIAMVAGGVMQLLAPQPRGLASRKDPDNAPSYAFGSPVNTTATGLPIGVLYGEREIGGAILSAAIDTQDFV